MKPHFFWFLISFMLQTTDILCSSAGISKITTNGNQSEFQNRNFTNETTIPSNNIEPKEPLNDFIYIILISILSLIGVTAIIAAGICWHRHTSLVTAAERVLYRSSDSSVLISNGNGHIGVHNYDNHGNGAHHLSALAKRTDYPAYGVTGPNPLHENPYEKPVDGVLNKSAEVFHYNQTKKKIKALSSSATSESGSSSKNIEPLDGTSELDVNDEETSDGEYTVYECSGFAAAIDGPMEVQNPLFDDMAYKSGSKSSFSYQNSGNKFHANPSYQNGEMNGQK